ncbi:hypothetical protein PHSC3_000768 [Chlamydiales bacterium STE3]|nr:hypothetical protein PHSC3_000768 [Chlamydiales bacterium STE3]
MRRVILLIMLLLLFLTGLASYLYFKNHPNDGLLILYGNVDVRQVDLGFRVSGRVDCMPFQEGEFVKKGSLLGMMDKQPYFDRVKEAQANIGAIKRNLENAENIFKRRKDLVRDGSISQEDFDNAQSTRDVLAANLKQAEASLGVVLTNLRDTEIFAPNDGVILTRIREPGAVVRESDPIYTLSLTSPIWVRTFVPEVSLGKIYPGMRTEIRTDTIGGKVYEGHIGFISPVAEFTPKTVETAQLRTDLVYRLRVIVENPDGGLRQGMPVTVTLHFQEKKAVDS